MPRARRVGSAVAPVVHTTIEMPTPAPTDETKEQKPDFWAYMASLTPEEWKNHIVYLTREEPKTSIKGGVGGYLAKLMQPFDIEDIKVAYGGREFSYIMKKGNTAVYGGRFRIEAPPKYDSDREETSSPAAADGGSAALMHQLVTVIREELQHSREANQGSSTTDEAIKMLSNASDRAMEVITKQIPQSADPTSQLAALVSVMDKLRPQQSTDLLSTIVIPLLKPLVEKLMTPVNPLDQLSQLATAMELIDKIRGGGGGAAAGKSDWKTLLAEGLIQKGPEILKDIRESQTVGLAAARERRATAEINARTADAIQRPGVTLPGVPAAPATAPAPGTRLEVVPLDSVPTAESGPTQVPDTGAFGAPPDKDADAVANFVKKKIVQLVIEGAEAEFIVDFLDTVDPTVADMLAQNSEEMVTTFLAGDPVLKAAVEHPNWKSFLAKARAYIRQSEQLETAPAN